MANQKWPLTLVRRGAKVPDDGSRWWQELPADTTTESVRSVGYEVVDVVPVQARKQRDEELRERLRVIPKENGIAVAFVRRSTVLSIFDEADDA